MEGILANVNARVLKEPRGFMKVLQFVFSICAFATTTSFSAYFILKITCTDEPEMKGETIKGEITFPFQVDRIHVAYNACSAAGKLNMVGDFSSDAGFFVAVGVLAFLYSVAALALYCCFTALYENNDLVPIGDFAVHVVFVILWLAASCAWANSLSGLRSVAALDNIIANAPDCNEKFACSKVTEARFGKLVSSVIFGFLNIFLWASNLWFLYKETRFYKDKQPGEIANTSN